MEKRKFGSTGVQVPVIGDRQTVHSQLLYVPHQIRDPVRSIEERVLAMTMQMDKRHRTPNLLVAAQGSKAASGAISVA